MMYFIAALNTLVVLLILPLCYFIYLTMTRPRNFPPGPLAFPFIGNVHRLAPVHKSVEKLAQEYGDIFTIKLSYRNMICVHGFKLIKEIMVDRAKEFSSRHKSIVTEIIRGKEYDGIVAAPYGPKWASHRKFYYTAFRNMGLNRNGIERRIADELSAITQELENMSQALAAFDPSFVLEYASLNVLASFMFGNRYDYDDQRLMALMDHNKIFFKKINSFNKPLLLMYYQIPNLYHYWVPQSTKELRDAVQNILDFANSEIKHHKATLDPKNPRDFIDYYLLEMEKSDNEWFTECRLQNTILDLFQAGTETTPTTLRWALLYMANYTCIQQKVHEEIRSVLGYDQQAKYEDRSSLPYCEATILEVQRQATIAPVGLLHAPHEDTMLRGYKILKGTPILPSFYSLHHSPDHWKNPNKFDPGNFLEPDGSVGNREAFFPFGGGLRICVGMQLAKQELFLFFVGIMQKFEVLPPPGINFLSEEPVVGATLSPEPYKLQFIPRY